MPKPLFDAPRAYAWETEEGRLCANATFYKHHVGSQPSSGAKIRGVRIVREADYRELLSISRRCADLEERL